MKQLLGTYTETGWEVFPQGLVDLLMLANGRYGNIPTYITGNRAAGTQLRTPKDSARWYSEVIASHGRHLAQPLPY